ncbi:MAG: acyltransferase family protein [Ferruginibacter sp.]
MMHQKERIYYLDWLRVFAFSILILFHSWQPFTNFHWLLKSDNKTIVADIFTIFFHTWRLHLIFFVSGVGTWLALRSRGKHFFYDRFLRLIVPFIFGAIVIVPCQYYYQMLQEGTDIRFVDFMINYPKFQINKDLQFNLFSWIIEIGIHLWYLPYLFIVTLLMFPLLKRIDTKGLSNTFIQKLTKRPGLVLLMALPIIIILITLKPIFPDYTSVADFFVYSCFFVYGFILIKEHARMLPILKRNHTVLLILGILSSLVLIGCLLDEPLRKAAFDPEYNLNHIIVSVPIGLSAFSWTLYFVSLFSSKFNFNNRALAELNRSVLPVYIVHQSIIVVAGFYIINYVNNGFLEFVLIVLTTIIGSILSYYFIKMFKVTRFLFGLKN